VTGAPGSSTTAAAYTGPASGPRPASSTPQTGPAAAGKLSDNWTCVARRSATADLHDALGRARGAVAPQRAVQLGESRRDRIAPRVVVELREQRLAERLRPDLRLDELGHHEFAAQDVGQSDPGLQGHPPHDPVAQPRQ